MTSPIEYVRRFFQARPEPGHAHAANNPTGAVLQGPSAQGPLAADTFSTLPEALQVLVAEQLEPRALAALVKVNKQARALAQVPKLGAELAAGQVSSVVQRLAAAARAHVEGQRVDMDWVEHPYAEYAADMAACLASVTNPSELSKLDISELRLTQGLFAELQKCTGLQSLAMKTTSVLDSPVSLSQIVDYLAKLVELRTLAITSDVEIAIIHCESLLPVVAKTAQLEQLILRRFRDHPEMLLKALKLNAPKIHTLEVIPFRVDLSERDMVAAGDISQLRHLALTDTPDLAQPLLGNLGSLISLSIEYRDLNGGNLSPAFLREAAQLRRLSVFGYNLNDENIAALAGIKSLKFLCIENKGEYPFPLHIGRLGKVEAYGGESGYAIYQPS